MQQIDKNQKALSVHAETNHKASIRVFEIFRNGVIDWKPACRAVSAPVKIS